jgi:hypothetical protein
MLITRAQKLSISKKGSTHLTMQKVPTKTKRSEKTIVKVISCTVGSHFLVSRDKTLGVHFRTDIQQESGKSF